MDLALAIPISIPRDILFVHIFPHCDIDIKVAFKIPPKKIKTNINLQKDNFSLKNFEIIARSHLQIIKNLYNWYGKIQELFNYFGIPEENRSFLVMKLVYIPQYRIIYGKNWRKEIDLLPGVDMDYIHFLTDPDISIYESLYPRECRKYVNRKN